MSDTTTTATSTTAVVDNDATQPSSLCSTATEKKEEKKIEDQRLYVLCELTQDVTHKDFIEVCDAISKRLRYLQSAIPAANFAMQPVSSFHPFCVALVGGGYGLEGFIKGMRFTFADNSNIEFEHFPSNCKNPDSWRQSSDYLWKLSANKKSQQEKEEEKKPRLSKREQRELFYKELYQGRPSNTKNTVRENQKATLQVMFMTESGAPHWKGLELQAVKEELHAIGVKMGKVTKRTLY